MPKNIFIPISIILAIGVIWMIAAPKGNQAVVPQDTNEVVRIENGVQQITIKARGGYSPNIVQAKANMPTVLTIETNGTYDCSAAVRIPSLGYSKNLPATGKTIIEIPLNKTTGSFDVLCSMGMYSSTINFIN